MNKPIQCVDFYRTYSIANAVRSYLGIGDKIACSSPIDDPKNPPPIVIGKHQRWI